MFLRVFRWKIEGHMPRDVSRAVFIAVPHTSNWDFVWALPIAWSYRVKPAFMGKDSLFRWPWGVIMRGIGGIPIDRARKTGVVVMAVEKLQETPGGLVLLVQPEGTRSRKTHWKSGFYHIADGAGVPIICSFLDFKRRTGGIGPILYPSGDLKADMDSLRAFYGEVTACYPEHMSPMRLKEEDALAEQPADTTSEGSASPEA